MIGLRNEEKTLTSVAEIINGELSSTFLFLLLQNYFATFFLPSLYSVLLSYGTLLLINRGTVPYLQSMAVCKA